MTHLVSKALAATVLALMLVPQQAGANDGKYMAGFYLSIKMIQQISMSGAADMWEALGASQKAQEINGLAADLEKGDLANEAAMNVFKASGSELQEQIEALEAAGAPLTKEQQEAARRAYLKIAGTTVLWAGAILAGKKVLESGELDLMSKLLIAALMASEAKSAIDSTRSLLAAWGSYREFVKGGSGMKQPSKQILEATPMLASL